MPYILTFNDACAAREQALAAERSTIAATPIAHTVGRLAALADLPEDEIRKAIHKRELPSLLVRRRRIILHDDAVAWLMRCRIAHERQGPLTTVSGSMLD